MKDSTFLRIKQKIVKIDPTRYWGDDFDVRFYLISKLKPFKNKSILDLGGGIGIIISELDKTNFRINLDYSFEELQICKNKINDQIHNICASMTNLPFCNESFDIVICCHLLEIAKKHDIEKNLFSKKDSNKKYPMVEKTLNEVCRMLKPDGMLFLTTPNNAYYKTQKLTFNELKKAIVPRFTESKIFFYNTYPIFSKKYRKLNMTNVIPKLKSKFTHKSNIVISLIKTHSKNNHSVSFFVEAKR